MDAETTLTPKADDAAALFERRIKEGAYGLRGIPGERRLASELGVSYMSARKVVQRLIDKKILRRAENGRLEPAAAPRESGQAKIAFVMPAFVSSAYQEWQFSLSQILEESQSQLHPVYYRQASDPLFFEALDADFDGLFLILPVSAPRLLLERLAKERHRVVILWTDLSHLGLLSINSSSNRFIGKLVEHLRGLGHASVDCFNVQPVNPVITDRINHWRGAIDQRGMGGQLYNYPIELFTSPILGAYREFGRMIDQGLTSKAYFCVTSEQARGVVRACHEKGVVVGKDISLCSIGENETARMMVPSLTIVPAVEPDYYLRLGVEWIMSRGENWQRPLLLEPDDTTLLLGESTGAA